MIRTLLKGWKAVRKDPRSGDLGIGLAVAFLVRFLPEWLGATAPADVWAIVLGLSAGVLSLCFDLIPEEDE